jgi:hypothetical protein
MIEELEQERDGLQKQLENIQTVEERKHEAVDDFINEMIELGATPPEDHHRVGALADKWFDGDADEAVTAIRDRARERDDVDRRILQ